MCACILLLRGYDDFFAVCNVTGRNVFHVLAMHPHHGNSAIVMAMLLARPDLYCAAAWATDRMGNTPYSTAIREGNMDCVRAFQASNTRGR